MDETIPLKWSIQLVTWDDWNTGSIAPFEEASWRQKPQTRVHAVLEGPRFSTWVAKAMTWASKVCHLIPRMPRQCKQSASIIIAVSAVYYCFLLFWITKRWGQHSLSKSLGSLQVFSQPWKNSDICVCLFYGCMLLSSLPKKLLVHFLKM